MRTIKQSYNGEWHTWYNGIYQGRFNMRQLILSIYWHETLRRYINKDGS